MVSGACTHSYIQGKKRWILYLLLLLSYSTMNILINIHIEFYTHKMYFAACLLAAYKAHPHPHPFDPN